MIHVREIDHVVICTGKPEEMIKFYCDVLGCTVERRLDSIGLVQMRAGRSLIDLVTDDAKQTRKDAAVREGRNMDHFSLRVEPFEIAEIRSHLSAHGVEASDVQTNYGAEGNGPSVYIKDPEGNLVELKGPPSD